MLAVLHSEERSRLFPLSCSCLQALTELAVELLMRVLGTVTLH